MTAAVTKLARTHQLVTAYAVTRTPLLPFSWAWQGVAAARRALYRRGWIKTRRLPRPVISVGNLAVGGAGKTPFVVFLTQYLLNHGANAAVLTRGYGRETRGRVVVRRPGESVKVGESAAGDEALMVARAVPRAAVVADEDRAAAGVFAFNELASDFVVLDDGYQYLDLYRDLNVLLLDARRPPGPTLPAGRYREGVAAARDADLVVFTKCREGDFRERWRHALRRAGAGAPQVEAVFSPSFLRPLHQTERVSLQHLAGAKVLAFAGIADFDGFARDLAEMGAVVARRRPFPDHHRYNHAELADAEGTAMVAGCDCLVTTAKDEVRLEGWRPAMLTYVVEQTVEIIAGYDVLNAALDRILDARKASRDGG